MPYCAAFGCTSNSKVKKEERIHFFSFPRDKIRRKEWVHFCRRSDFDVKHVTEHSRLCSLHFSPSQYARDPKFLLSFGYVNAKPSLHDSAIPDIPLVIVSNIVSKPVPVERGAFAKRRRLELYSDVRSSTTSSKSDATEQRDAGTPVDPEVHANATVQDQNLELELTDDNEPTVSTSSSSSTKEPIQPSKHFQCQVSIAVPKPKVHLKNRRNQTKPVRKIARMIQVKPVTRTIGTQVNMIPVEPEVMSDCQSEDDEDGDHYQVCSEMTDPSYNPPEDYATDEEEEVDEENDHTPTPLRRNPEPLEERFFLVAESSLFSLSSCQKCENTSTVIKNITGTMIKLERSCLCGTYSWDSQPKEQQTPLGNLLLSSSVLLSGSSPAKVIRLFNHLKTPIFSRRTYDNLQSCYLVPSIIDTWPSYQSLILQDKNRPIIAGGDARCDSPGYSAKYGSYSIMDLRENLILDVQLVQSNEVKSSTHMELTGLKRGIPKLEEQGCRISHLVTDRHNQVQKYMREEQPHIRHLYDVWHVAKGVQKKLEAASKKKDCAVITEWIQSISNHMYWVAAGGGSPEVMLEKWKSVLNHICNIHSGHGKHFKECEHGPIEDGREWIIPGSRAYKAVKEVIENPNLLRAIPKLSHLDQTYSLEVYHNVVNHFAPKSNHFFYPSMKARLFLSAMHYNENSRRGQATTKAGLPRWRICYPRAKKGQKAVAKPVCNGPTYEYVDFLREIILERKRQLPTYQLAREDYKNLTACDPGFLTKSFVQIDKAQLVSSRSSRYNLHPEMSPNSCHPTTPPATSTSMPDLNQEMSTDDPDH